MIKYLLATGLLFLSFPCFASPLKSSPSTLLSTLTLREKIAQLFFIAAAGDDESDPLLINLWRNWQPEYCLNPLHVEKIVTDNQVGGVIFYGKNAKVRRQVALTKRLQQQSKIPLFIAVDGEVGLGGLLNQKNVIRFPYPMTLAATRDADLIYTMGLTIGHQLKTIGVHINFAPVADINSNPNNPVIGMRAFGSDKEVVSELSIAYMQGLQDSGIIACAKHFPGHGDTDVDSHMALPVIHHTFEHLDNEELYPFKKIISAGVKSIMTAHLAIPALEATPGLPSSLSKAIVTELLQGQLGFNGLIFTDALGMKGVADYFEVGEVELRALQAGNDILLCPLNVVRAIDYIERAVYRGEITVEEIDRKALKVLRAKEGAIPDNNADIDSWQSTFRTPEALELCRTLYAKAITLLKTESDHLEPFPPLTTVVVNTDPSLPSFEQTIREETAFTCVRKSFKKDLKSIQLLNWLKRQWDGSDIALDNASHVIISASRETFDDKDGIPELLSYMRTLKNKGKHVTLVLFCSPYFIPLANEADTIILAYEPVIDAVRAVVDVLKGKSATGVLPVQGL